MQNILTKILKDITYISKVISVKHAFFQTVKRSLLT